ncbi:hypothetical protein FRZ44_21310 [Hypericibacter terrae]|uniref:Zinc chelation protein SecC n=1 Tax=Hypericibacter terrae TaxID=2602015 RepID=A0A5J6MPV2_9PROT|nr:DUF1186 domain-containing protein [Hypericibacter terrae]QEX16836.1 hypothetical protein FRZ44_21310 [Hypericibacter terrae]
MTIDDIIRDFATTGSTLPRSSMQWALENWDDAYPRFAGLLEAYVGGTDRSEEAERALLFVIYLLAEKDEKRAFRALCSLIREAEAIETILDDGITEDMEAILISMFDGSEQVLNAVIEDVDADEFVRAGALLARAYLTRTGHFTDDEMRAYLQHLFDEMEPRGPCYVWAGWLDAVSLLGYGDLAARAEELCRLEFVEPGIMNVNDFRGSLRRTLGDPERMAGFEHRRIAPYTDAIGSLSRWYCFSGQYKADQARYAREGDDDEEFGDIDLGADLPQLDILVPRINPLRHVGRNDLCPCGSGKKFKKCCLSGPGTTP